jgi:hypothetical protein
MVIMGNGMDGTAEMTTIASIAMVMTVEGRRDTRASTIRAPGVTENTRAIAATIINRQFEKSSLTCAKRGKKYMKAAANYEATSKSSEGIKPSSAEIFETAPAKRKSFEIDKKFATIIGKLPGTEETFVKTKLNYEKPAASSKTPCANDKPT